MGKMARPVRAVFREGIEAALMADPTFLATRKNRTTLGWIVRQLVLDAGRGKVAALKAMLALLDTKESWEDADAEGVWEEPQWDWTPEGVWEGRGDTEAEVRRAQQTAARAAGFDRRPPAKPPGQAREELAERLRRKEQFAEEERLRKAALAEAEAGAAEPANSSAIDNSAKGPTVNSGESGRPVITPHDPEPKHAPATGPPDDGATWLEVNGRQVRLGTRP